VPKIIVIIPARVESTRLPNKLLKVVKGKPLIWHTYEAAKRLGGSETYVATDSEEITRQVCLYGGRVIQTGRDHLNGTLRVIEAAESLEVSETDWIVNWQGDEPLVEAEDVRQLIRKMKFFENWDMGTLVSSLKGNQIQQRNVVKVVIDLKSKALYFTRLPLPGAFKHVGIYLFNRFLFESLKEWSPMPLANLEGLEQLSVLEIGFTIGTVPTKTDSYSINDEQDFLKFQERRESE